MRLRSPVLTAPLACPRWTQSDLDPGRNGDLLASRADLAASLNFVLPQHISVAGSYTICVKRVFTTDLGVELADAASGVSRTVTLLMLRRFGCESSCSAISPATQRRRTSRVRWTTSYSRRGYAVPSPDLGHFA